MLSNQICFTFLSGDIGLALEPVPESQPAKKHREADKNGTAPHTAIDISCELPLIGAVSCHDMSYELSLI